MKNLLHVIIQYYNDINNKDEDLYPLAATALRRLEKLNFNK